MIKIEYLEEYGIRHAFRAMRNPMDSWRLSTKASDIKLAKSLIASGTEHRTFLRQVQTWCDITAPLYWWKEMDRYTVGKSQVSCSTMHKLGSRRLTPNDFSMCEKATEDMLYIIAMLNDLIMQWQTSEEKSTWLAIIQLLPSGYMQTRSVNQSLECVLKQIEERSSHKLEEWREYCDFMKQNTFLKELL
jgi:hypothetical protein